MKICSFLVAFSLTVVLANALSTQEHVKRFFRPEHRMYLPDTSTLQLEDESSVPQNDESTKCLSVCEPTCQKLNVPEYLTVNIILHFVAFRTHVDFFVMASWKCDALLTHFSKN